MKRNTALTLVVLGILILNIVQLIYLQYASAPEFDIPNIKQGTASAIATASFCINHAPEDITHSCNLTMQWLTPYTCQMNGTDLDNDTLSFESIFLTSTSLFSISNEGLINFTPAITDAGIHTFRILAYDDSNCENDNYYEDITINITTFNLPPRYIALVQNVTLSKGTSFIFDLDDHFTDPNGDNLTYFYTKTNTTENYTTITINNDSLVNIYAADCGISRFYFVAADPDGLTNQTQSIGYTITGCPTSSSGGSSSSGGGSGSGGGSSCTSEWRCGKWGKCSIQNITERECVDQNGCDPDDYNRKLQKACTYVYPTTSCNEDWVCGDWTDCINGTQKRSCIDNNSCGTSIGKPEDIRLCTGTDFCFNGIKDNGETGIDCGGPCTKCTILERPAEIVRNNYLWVIILLSIAVLAIAFRKKILEWTEGIFAKKKHKQKIYLKEEQKQMFLKKISATQELIKSQSLKKAKMESISIIQQLNSELGIKDLVKDLNVIKSIKLQKIIVGINNKSQFMSIQRKEEIFEIQEILDEIESIMYMLSGFTDKDALTSIKERTEENYPEKPKDNKDRIYIKISNAFIALRFEALHESKIMYKEILMDYELLGENAKQSVYPDILRLYATIKYYEFE